jgi:DNA helicase-2/ATP-dependent DNA helicase PcrA
LPTLSRVDTDEEKLARAASQARAALLDNPAAHVCVVAPRKRDIEHVAKALQALLGADIAVRQGHNEGFEFAPGITVTNYRQVKGLEFDTVIVLDPTNEAYPATEQGRRNLYMVVTRAKDALHLVAAGEPTSLLRAALDGGLLALTDDTSVPVAELGAEADEPF